MQTPLNPQQQELFRSQGQNASSANCAEQSLEADAYLLIQKLKAEAKRLRRKAFATEQLVEELEGAMNEQS